METRVVENAGARRVLLTGFEPFDGEPVNPSASIAQTLDGREIAGRRVIGRVLPCVFGEAAERLRAWIDELEPELVVCVGQAGGRAEISLERVAINIDDARIADNAGRAPIDEPVVAGAPTGYWSTLPIKAIVAALRAEGIPAGVSQTAGTFVCNHVFYALMHALAERDGRMRGGFVHVPFLPEQAERRAKGEPSLALEAMERALEIIVMASMTREVDARYAGGATD